MRFVVFVLVIANVGFFGWSYWQGAQAQPVQPPAAVAPLQLATARTMPATQCRSLGPLHDSEQALAVSAALTARGVGSLVRQIDRKVTEGNWVYIDGIKSVAERQRALQKLRRAGLRDVAEMPGAQYAGRISAGIFVDPRGAAE